MGCIDRHFLMTTSLNGDYNPLHATPLYGQKMGYGGIIMHGVYAYNSIAHEFVRALGGGDPASLREMSAKFAGPVRPGDSVKVELWKVGAMGDGWEDMRWVAEVGEKGNKCLTDGRAQIKVAKISSKI